MPVLTTIALLLLTGCVTNGAAFTASQSNRLFISQVKLGQASDEVRKVMHHAPETTAVKQMPDGTTEEVWTYLTDYDSDTNTTLTFRDGKLVGIAQTHWEGTGNFNQPPTWKPSAQP